MEDNRTGGRVIQLRNCQILRNHSLIHEDLWIRDGKILNPEKLFYDEQRSADIQLDCRGLIISPGFIDSQINGAFGIDFSDASIDMKKGFHKVSKGLLAHGVTSFCPTLVTSTDEIYHKVVPVLKKQNGSKEGAGNVGLHLEGPFIDINKKGAHTPEYISQFKKGFQSVIDMYGPLDNVAIVTLAPELERSQEVIKGLVDQGIVVSLGHSSANLAQGEEAVRAGASFITHLFNAMLPFHHRDPHLVGLLSSDNIPADRCVYYGMIADGVHTHAAALRIAHRTHPTGLVLVTDAVPAMGMEVGTHRIGAQKVEIRETGAFIAGTNTLCGSTTTMNQCVQFFHEKAEGDKVEVLEAATQHPAKMLGISDHKGTLNYGADADFVLLDDNLNVMSTYINGEEVWQSKNLTPLQEKYP